MDIKDKEIQKIEAALDSPAAVATRLRRVRNLANLSRQEMCNTGDLNINTYKGWEVARFGGLTQEGAEKVVARLFSASVVCTIEWLLCGSGSAPYLLDISSSQQSVGLAKKSEKNNILNELINFQTTHHDAVYSEIIDDCMFPFYEIGDFVAGIKVNKENIDSAIDKHCIVKIKNGLTIVRYFRKSTLENRFYLIPLNQKSNTPLGVETEIDFVAPILRHYKNHTK